MFYKTAASRSVWLAALNRVCEQHGIYKPTYPTEKMTVAELEHAASGPHRFVRFVTEFESASPSICKQPYLTRQFPCRRRLDDPGNTDGLYRAPYISLIPGGRFLVTASAGTITDATKGTVCLWDLGYNMNSPMKPFPIATASTQSSIISFSTCPSANGIDIIVAVQGYL